MLAYLFWHRPKPDSDVAAYEDAQRAFHAGLDVPSACFRLAELPFGGDAGYEDWYLIEDWQELGELNRAAVDPTRGPFHNRAASSAAMGWGGVYSLMRGPAAIPDGVEWLDKRRGDPSDDFVAALPHDAVWRRQLVLGPAPEFCVSAAPSPSREQI
jgi:hypothetical protein